MADSIHSITAVCVGIAACGWKRKVNGARADAVGALICSVTIIAVMIFICVQWVRALKVYLNYDQYEDTVLERPSTKPQGIAHVIVGHVVLQEGRDALLEALLSRKSRPRS